MTDRLPRIPNRAASSMVTNLRPFEGSNLFARETFTEHSKLYSVFSYGFHFPMYVAETVKDPDTGEHVTHWYVNTDRFSRTTSKHQGQTHPLVQRMVPMDTDRMKHIARGGLMELVQRGLA